VVQAVAAREVKMRAAVGSGLESGKSD
jgi:hypothetical protein